MICGAASLPGVASKNGFSRNPRKEATRLAGFGASEARRFFGPPPSVAPAIERDYLTPWPAGTAEKRFLERVAPLLRS